SAGRVELHAVAVLHVPDRVAHRGAGAERGAAGVAGAAQPDLPLRGNRPCATAGHGSAVAPLDRGAELHGGRLATGTAHHAQLPCTCFLLGLSEVAKPWSASTCGRQRSTSRSSTRSPSR